MQITINSLIHFIGLVSKYAQSVLVQDNIFKCFVWLNSQKLKHIQCEIVLDNKQ